MTDQELVFHVLAATLRTVGGLARWGGELALYIAAFSVGCAIVFGVLRLAFVQLPVFVWRLFRG